MKKKAKSKVVDGKKKIKIKAAIDEMEINRTIHRRKQIDK